MQQAFLTDLRTLCQPGWQHPVNGPTMQILEKKQPTQNLV